MARRLAVVVLLLAILAGGMFIGARLPDPGKPGTRPPAARAPAPAEPRPRVILVGLDGADWDVVGPLVDAGRLPNLRRLIGMGAAGNLRSVEPMLSPLIWTTIATGKTADKHGILDFRVRDPATAREVPTTSNLRKVKALWNILTERGRSVGVVGWLATYPAEAVNGFLVTDRLGYLAYDFDGLSPRDAAGKTYPPALLGEIEPLAVTAGAVSLERLNRFITVSRDEAEAALSERFSPQNPVNDLRLTLATADTYGAVARALFSRERPDLAMVYFEAPDATSHLFMQHRPPRRPSIGEDEFRRFSRAVDEMYVRSDEILGGLLEGADAATTVIVVSDHGFRSGEKRPEGRSDIGLGDAAGWHRLDGVFIAAGRGIRRGARVKGASVLDVAPTVLALLGLPVAADMDGHVLTDALEPTFAGAHPWASVPTYEDPAGATPAAAAPVESPDDERIRERLVSLGYVSADARPARMNRVSVLRAQGKNEEAAKELAALIAEDPKDGPAHVVLAEVEGARGRVAEARRELEAAAELDPAFRGDLGRRAALHRSIGDLERAEALYREALAAAPGKAEVLIALSAVLVERGDPASAERLVGEVLERDPANAAALAARGRIAIARNQPAEAEAAFRRVLERAPADPPALVGLANALVALRRPADAAPVLRAYVALRPRDAEAAYQLGLLELELGRPGEAVALLRPLERARPDDVPLALALGLAYARRGQYEQAEELFRKVVAKEPSRLEARLYLGNARQMRGDVEGAIAEYRRAIEANPGSALAKVHLANGLIAARRFDEAGAALDEAERLDPKLGSIPAARAQLEKGSRAVAPPR